MPATLASRVPGALLLCTRVFAEIAADTRFGSAQAAFVVLASGLLEAASREALHGRSVVAGGEALAATLAALVGWAMWTGILWGLGDRAFGHAAAPGSVARAVGLAHAPGLINGLGLVPGLELAIGALYVASVVWFALALALAVRGVFGVGLGRATAIAAAGFAVHEVARQGLRLAGIAG